MAKEFDETTETKGMSEAKLKADEKKAKQGRDGRPYHRSNKAYKDGRQSNRSNSKIGKSNDPKWYANNPELMRAAASLPYSVTTGMDLPFGSHAVPGICSIYWKPSFGNADALNQAANMVYSTTVHANSRNTRYDAPDELLIILAGAQVFSALAYGIRAFGIMHKYNQVNKYTPKALLQSMGLDYDDLLVNLPNMWFDLNDLISASTQIWIPNIFPLVTRWFWLNSNIYMDAASAKSQHYVYVQDLFYVYSERTSDKGGQLIADTTWGHTSDHIDDDKLHTWADYVALVRRMLNALLSSQDRGIIFGDILKAYGEAKLFVVNPIAAGYEVQYSYDEEVLSQIENAISNRATIQSVNSDADTNSLNFTWEAYNSSQYAGGGYATIENSILNFHQKDTPSVEQNMVATRLKPGPVYARKPAEGEIYMEMLDSGSEIVHTFCMWYFGNGTYNSTLFKQVFNSCVRSNQISTSFMATYSAFDWMPWIYIINSVPSLPSAANTSTSQVVLPDDALGDYQMYTTLNMTSLQKMNRTAIYSELGVPHLM
nr:putative capsid [Marmot picobirnavirus]